MEFKCIGCDMEVEEDRRSNWDYCKTCDEQFNEEYYCQICGKTDEDEVGIATGENGKEMRVCKYCDVDGSNYNGWGDKNDDDDDGGWCNEDCEKAEGCIECNPMAFCSAETFAKWQDDCVSRMKHKTSE